MSGIVSCTLAASVLLAFSALGEGVAEDMGSLKSEGSSAVRVKLEWDHNDLPGAMKSFLPREGLMLKVWKTEVVKDAKNLPISSQIPESTFELRPGEAKTFVLVFKNETDRHLYFFAAPHLIDPPEFSLGFKLKCLCINHAFEVGPGEIWYRVVEARLSKNFVGREMEIRHTLVGIDKERKRKFTLPLVDLSGE